MKNLDVEAKNNGELCGAANRQTQLFSLQPSKNALRGAMCLYALAALATLLTPLSSSTQGFVLLWLGLEFWRTRKQLRREQVALRYIQGASWQVLQVNRPAAVEILQSSVITPVAVFLHYKPRTQARTWREYSALGRCSCLFISADSLSIADYRRLIVLLKITL